MPKGQKWNGHTPFVKGHRYRVGLKHTVDFCEGRKGEGNPNWKGGEVGKKGLHSWIRKNYGRPRLCEVCGVTEAKIFDWANLDYKYQRVRKSWKRMCRSCHMKYDYKNGNRIPYKKYENKD